MRIKSPSVWLAVLLTGISVSPTFAAPLTPGSVLVYRVGDGSAPLSANGNPVFIDEYNAGGTLLQSLAMPTTASGTSHQLIASQSPTEGLITTSPNGQYVAFTGYATDLGGSLPLNGTSSGTISRTVGILSVSTGLVDTSTTLNNVGSSHPRSAVTTNGTDIWLSINGAGTRHATLGATSASASLTTGITPRLLTIFGNQIYGATNTGIGTIGTGTETTTGQEFTMLPGTEPSSGDNDGAITFFFADLSTEVTGLDTLYVAGDDFRALSKYSLVDGTWALNGIVGATSAPDDNYAGVTGLVSGSTVTLFATRRVSSSVNGGGELVKLVDESGHNGVFAGTPTVLATASASIGFRGVTAVPVIAPSGDFDGDGDVDGADFVAWQTNFPLNTGASSGQGDADGDGDVDGADFAVWQNGFPAGSGSGVNPVPEPCSIIMFVLGGVLTACLSRRIR